MADELEKLARLEEFRAYQEGQNQELNRRVLESIQLHRQTTADVHAIAEWRARIVGGVVTAITIFTAITGGIGIWVKTTVSSLEPRLKDELRTTVGTDVKDFVVTTLKTNEFDQAIDDASRLRSELTSIRDAYTNVKLLKDNGRQTLRQSDLANDGNRGVSIAGLKTTLYPLASSYLLIHLSCEIEVGKRATPPELPLKIGVEIFVNDASIGESYASTLRPPDVENWTIPISKTVLVPVEDPSLSMNVGQPRRTQTVEARLMTIKNLGPGGADPIKNVELIIESTKSLTVIEFPRLPEASNQPL